MKFFNIADQFFLLFLDNETYDVSRDRVTLENFTYQGMDYANGVFIVEKVTMDDRGYVTCVIVDRFLNDSTAQASCMVRVKGKFIFVVLENK